MLKSIFKIALLSSVAVGGTSYFMASADAESKFLFRYTPGSINVASGSNSNSNGGGTTEPEIPVEPEPEPEPEPENVRFSSERSYLSLVDTNGNGVADIGETLVNTVVIKNIGTKDIDSFKVGNSKFRTQSSLDTNWFRESGVQSNCDSYSIKVNETTNCTASLKLSAGILPQINREYAEIIAFPPTVNISTNNDISYISHDVQVSNFDKIGVAIEQFEMQKHLVAGDLKVFIDDKNGNGLIDAGDSYTINIMIDNKYGNPINFDLMWINHTNFSSEKLTVPANTNNFTISKKFNFENFTASQRINKKTYVNITLTATTPNSGNLSIRSKEQIDFKFN